MISISIISNNNNVKNLTYTNGIYFVNYYNRQKQQNTNCNQTYIDFVIVLKVLYKVKSKT